MGTVPIRISMMRPIPFCPSLDPWAKLTPVQVKISSARIQGGGGTPSLGSRYSSSLRMRIFIARNSKAATPKPTKGEKSSAWPISVALLQSTPAVPLLPCIIALATPTPMIDPISVCELEEGMPSHQVARFHRIAAISSANTMAKPALDPTCRMSSTGSSETMPKATAPVESSTPRKLKKPDQTTATLAGMALV